MRRAHPLYYDDNAKPAPAFVTDAAPTPSSGPWAQRIIGFNENRVRCLRCGAIHDEPTLTCPACGAGSTLL